VMRSAVLSTLMPGPELWEGVRDSVREGASERCRGGGGGVGERERQRLDIEASDPCRQAELLRRGDRLVSAVPSMVGCSAFGSAELLSRYLSATEMVDVGRSDVEKK
jgi:hypothetical protein